MKDGSEQPWTVDSISGTFENSYQIYKKLEPKNGFFTRFEILVEFFPLDLRYRGAVGRVVRTHLQLFAVFFL